MRRATDVLIFSATMATGARIGIVAGKWRGPLDGRRSGLDPTMPTCDVHRDMPVRGAELCRGRGEVVAYRAR
jgi:hypothetical protein